MSKLNPKKQGIFVSIFTHLRNAFKCNAVCQYNSIGNTKKSLKILHRDNTNVIDNYICEYQLYV